MLTATVEDIMSFGPCDDYPEERVRELWAGREILTQDDIAGLDIPVLDRIWALSEMLHAHSPWRANRVARRIALDVEPYWGCPDVVWWYLVTGYEAAWDTAWDTAWNTAWDAVWNPARAAARSAAWDAVWDTARAASRVAISDAARDASRVAISDAARYAALEKYLIWILEVM
jgi:hypothetical protein